MDGTSDFYVACLYREPLSPHIKIDGWTEILLCFPILHNIIFFRATIRKGTRPSEANDASFSDFFIIQFCSNSFIFSLSSSLLTPRPSFFLVQHCLNHLESVKGHFSAILTKALPTDRPTDQPTDKASYRDADASKKYFSNCPNTFMICLQKLKKHGIAVPSS